MHILKKSIKNKHRKWHTRYGCGAVARLALSARVCRARRASSTSETVCSLVRNSFLTF